MSEPTVAVLDAADPGFAAEFARRLAWESVSDETVQATVAEVITRIRAEGDAALLDYTRRFDRLDAASAAALEVARARIDAALESIDADTRAALEVAAERIRDYHSRQTQESWHYRDADGSLLGQQITPLDRVGIYVPGGKASYPSSVLMNALPAQVAGVGEIIMAVPAPGGELNDAVLAAAAIAGVDRVFTIGGAQAIAALAYGTETVPRVDKIVGPGNIFVATAKRQVFGQVGLDMVAGPSEICIVCDGQTDPDWIVYDLFSQAEHDEDAQAILVSDDHAFVDRVAQRIEALLPGLERVDVIRQSLAARGMLIKVADLDAAIALVNEIAPEHLELSIADAEQWLGRIRHAGAIFVGRYTPEALGDYCAGPNHVLPTSQTARFSSPLGVYDFQKRSSVIGCSPAAADRLGRIAATLAASESLTAHARSALCRVRDDRD